MRITMRRLLLLGGVAASALYVATDAIGALVYPGYSYTAQTISELSAIGAPSRPIVTPLFGLYPPLVFLFAIGVWLGAGDRRRHHVIAALLAVYAVACIGFAPMHTREVLAAGGGTSTDTMHLVMTSVDSLLLIAIIVLGSRTAGGAFRWYSLATLAIILGAGAYTGMHGGDVGANRPTPWIGVSERISVFGAMTWLAVFAVTRLGAPPADHPPSLRAWVRRRPVLAYVATTFAISWGGIVALVGPGNLFASKELFESYVWVPPLLLGPSVAGVLVTALAGGRRGLRAYGARILRWRVGARWYAAALLVAPLYYLVTAAVLSLSSPAYLPNVVVTADRPTLIVQGMIIALAAGFFEELGWTGCAVPALRRRHGATATGVIVGVVWGAWHILPEMLGATAFGLAPYLAIQLVAVVVGLTGFRVLMVWVHERTESTLLGMIMHASLTASLLLLQPVVVGRSLLVVGIVLDLVPWLIVAGVAGMLGAWCAVTTTTGWSQRRLAALLQRVQVPSR